MESNVPLIQCRPKNTTLKEPPLIGPCMNSRHSLMATILFFPFVCGAQEQSVIPLKSEPHHHLALRNDYVNVYSVYVPPQDSVLLHKHDVDAIGIVMSDSEITVRSPVMCVPLPSTETLLTQTLPSNFLRHNNLRATSALLSSPDSQ